ncbi:MAG: ribosome maturation factor RimP [Bacteroidota bacterium]
MVNDQLREVINRCADQHAAHVIDVVLRGRHHRPIVEVFIDTEEGVTTELCSEVSREIASILLAEPLINPAYELIVSSPGIERPLIFPWQYKKHVGRKLIVKTNSDAGLVEQIGDCAAVDESGITLHTGKSQETVRIEFASIKEARVKAPW